MKEQVESEKEQKQTDSKKRKQFEYELVKSFAEYLKENNIEVLKFNCRNKNYADIEYKNDNVLYRVEAKTHLSGDRHNAVHKLFGELLKMTSYEIPKNQKVKYQVLLDGRKNEKGNDSFEYFSDVYSKIPKDKFLDFEKLIPVDKVIVFNPEEKSEKEYNWEDLYQNSKK